MTAANGAPASDRRGQWRRAHGDLCRRRRVARDRAGLLTALLSMRPAIGRPGVTRKADRLCLASGRVGPLLGACRQIGRQVAVAESDGRLLVADTSTGQGRRRTRPGGPGARRRCSMSTTAGPSPRHAARCSPKTLEEKAFVTLGFVAEQFMAGSAASGNARMPSDRAQLAALPAAHARTLSPALGRVAADCENNHREKVRRIA